MNVYIMTVGTGTATCGKRSDVMHGIASSIRNAQPAPDAFLLVPSSAEDSLLAAEIVLEYLDKWNVPVRQKFTPYGEGEDFYQLSDPNDLLRCRSELSQLIGELKERYREACFYVNPTSGTKPMTAAAILAGIEAGMVDVQYTVGQRVDGVVATGTEQVLSISAESLYELRAIRETLQLYRHNQWAAGVLLLKPYQNNPAYPFSAALLQVGQAYSAWDRFEYKKAREIFENIHYPAPDRNDPDHAVVAGFLEACRTQSAAGLPQKRNVEYRMGDLLANLERRMKAGRYDDAVARCYRLTEMIMTERLRQEFGVDFERVDDAEQKILEALSGNHAKWIKSHRREGYGDSKDTFFWGVNDLVRLLQRMKDPPLAIDKWSHLLKQRNGSLLAHGSTPVGREIATKFQAKLENVLKTWFPKVLDWRNQCQFPEPDLP